MQTNRWLLGTTLTGLLLLHAFTAAAQSSTVASTLFQQAVAKMEAEQFTEACPLLEDSHRLEPKPGTLFTLANCRDREGKFATAQARYGEYLRAHAAMKDLVERERHAARATIAQERLKALAGQVPTLEIRRDETIVGDVKVWMDGVELSAAMLNIALPFDPGAHELVSKRPNAPEDKRTVTLEVGQAMVIDLTAELGSQANTEGTETAVGSMPPATVPSKGRSHPRRTAGFISLGLGGAGLAFGAVMGGLAAAEKQMVNAHCAGPRGYSCDRTGFTAVEQMRTYTTPSTIGFIAGGVLAGVGVVLLATAPRASTEKPLALEVRAFAAPGRGFIGLEGAF